MRKVNLTYITNDSARKATFKKRKTDLIKKANQLKTLCAVDACALIFSPYDAEPVVWPSHLGAQHVIARFRRMSDLGRGKKKVNQESFAQEMLTKNVDQLNKLQKENHNKGLTNLMFRCLIGGGFQGLDLANSRDLSLLLNQNKSGIESRIQFLKE